MHQQVMRKLYVILCLLSINLFGAEYTLTFDIDPNGKASWQNLLKEYRGRTFTVDSKEKYLELVNAKARVILTANAMDLHVLYGKGSDQEQYEKFLAYQREVRSACLELKRLLNLYSK